MRAMVLDRPAPIELGPLASVERPVPEPGLAEILVRVSACAICRTDLHLVEGELPPVRSPLVPGHQVIGRVERTSTSPPSSAFASRDMVRSRFAASVPTDASAATPCVMQTRKPTNCRHVALVSRHAIRAANATADPRRPVIAQRVGDAPLTPIASPTSTRRAASLVCGTVRRRVTRSSVVTTRT